MKLSDNTKEILKNFSEINPNLKITPGKEIKTISTMKNILATAGVEEEFPQDIAIYDLSEFLGMLSLFNKPTFTFDEKFMTINEEGTSTKSRYYFADESILTTPQEDVKMPATEVEFTLTQTTYDVKVGVCDTNKKFEFHFKTEHFKMLPGDYNVYISSKLISNFRHKNKTVQYWIALENTSKYEG